MIHANTQPVAFQWIESRESSVVYKVAIALAFAILTAIGAQVRIPLGFTPVPITLQTMFVFSSGLFLGARYGLLSQVIYVAMGLIGMPVFSQATSGAQVMFGATGGYLVGFLLFSYFSGKLFYERLQSSGNFLSQMVQLYALSVVAVFVPGVLVLKLATGVPWWQALVMGYFPFVFGDLAKIAIGLAATRALKR